MNDRRQIAFAQTQTKKPKSKKTRAPKLRKVGTSTLNKQRKLKRVNSSVVKLEGDYKRLCASAAFLRANNIALEKENARLQKLLDACVTNEAQLAEAYNAGLSEFAWWKDGVQYVGTCGKLLKDHLKK